jgi:hypothetical protein
MFQAISCSSSLGQIVLIQNLVSSLSVSDRPVHPLVGWLVGWLVDSVENMMMHGLANPKIFRRVRKTAKSDYKLLHACITPAVYIKTIYRFPIGRPVITFYTLCLGGNLSTGLPLQISSD